MKNEYLDCFELLEKATHQSIWLNFKYRIANIKFGVIDGPDNNWCGCEQATADEFDKEFLIDLPENYADMDYRQIRHIRMDRNPLPHWEKIYGMLSVMDSEILHFMIHAEVPLDQLIRYELAIRGRDKNDRWCGFEKAEEIWLKE